MPSTGLKKSIEMKRAVNPENREKEDIENKERSFVSCDLNFRIGSLGPWDSLRLPFRIHYPLVLGLEKEDKKMKVKKLHL